MPALPPLVTGLLRPTAYPHPTRDIRLIETHISWVILTGDVVYKLKKPVDLGFLDFSTLARRRACCDEEVRLSSRFAPELYLGVVPITGSEQEPHVGPSPEPHASPEPIEWAVMLRQFDEGGRLDRLFAEGRLAPVLRDALADRGLVSLYREVELPLIAILADMEDLGVLIDVEFLDELRRDLTTACARHEAAIHAAAGESFNVNSAAQLRRVLFETLGLTPVKKTGTGQPSTDRKSTRLNSSHSSVSRMPSSA